MGVHFTVTVDHDIRDTALASVRERFRPLNPFFDELSTAEFPPDRWRDLTEPGSESAKLFYTPGGFSLSIGTSALRMHHCTKFELFTQEPTVRAQLRHFSKELALLFGKHVALYTPCEGVGDTVAGWVIDDLTLSDMELRLRTECEPAATFEELAARSLPDLRYYIDVFFRESE